MAVVVYTGGPTAILASIRKNIDDVPLVTWSYDKEGDFTHTPDQFVHLAWFRPIIVSGILQFGLLGQKDVGMSKYIYGIYHGRFIEMLLDHFDNDFTNVTATAQKLSQVDLFK